MAAGRTSHFENAEGELLRTCSATDGDLQRFVALSPTQYGPLSTKELPYPQVEKTYHGHRSTATRHGPLTLRGAGAHGRIGRAPASRAFVLPLPDFWLLKRPANDRRFAVPREHDSH